MGYLGKSRGNQTMNERLRKKFNLVLKVKFQEDVRFVCEKEKGVFLQPDELAVDSTGQINKTVTLLWRENILAKQFPPVLRYKCTRRRLFSFPSILRRKP